LAASPANPQYSPAPWSVGATGSQITLALQSLGLSSAYLAIYRVSNNANSNPVTVTTDSGQALLRAGTSVDVSTQKITIQSQNQPASGTIQLLCCAVATGPTNPQYLPASWSVGANLSETILSLQLLGVSSAYLAIYRVANSGDGTSSQVTVNTAGGQFSLLPGRSIDVSTQTITIVSQGPPAHGTLQLLCCSLATVPVSGHTNPIGTTLFAPPFDPLVFLNGGNGGNGGGGLNGGGPFDPLTFPE
jgi:hypothetical protein